MTPVAPSSDARDTALRAVAAYGLPGSLHQMPARPLEDREFLHLHAGVRSQKLTGLFWSAIRDGAFPVTSWQLDRAEESHVQRLVGTLFLEDLLLSAVDTLRRHGIPVRVLKGAAMAHLDYADPSERTIGDIDLLVPGRLFDAAASALRSIGCTARFPEPRPGFHRRFGKGTCLVSPEGLEVDLHRTFATGPFGERLAVGELWEGRETFELAGVMLEALPVEARILHAAYHAALGDREVQLVPLRDLAQLLLTKPVDLDRLRSLMRASRGEAVVARSVRSAWENLSLADVLAVSAWAQGYREDERSSTDLAVYEHKSTYATRSFATVKAIPSVSEKVRYLAAMAMPQRAYLDGRHRTHRDRIRKGLWEIRRLRSPR